MKGNPMKRNVLITGTSSGFGKLIAQSLIKSGHGVVGSMREPEARNKAHAEELKALGAQVVSIDVTNDQSVEQGTKQAIEHMGKIDTVVNNAGIGVLGLQEMFTSDDWRRLFEVNVFGVQRVNRALLPYMRENKDGLLIQISSLLGRFCIPFFGPYNASKFAVEALAENYRIELANFGIDSVIVEPGAFGTDFGARLMHPSDNTRAESYGEFTNAPAAQMEAFGPHLEGENAPDPQWVADAVLKLVETPKGERPFRTVVDGLGMGEAIEKYNQAAEETTQSILSAFGMSDLLELK